MVRELLHETGGNVAILFGITLLPVACLVGVALDYNRAIDFRTFAHREVDAAALAIASADTPNSDKVIPALKERLNAYWGQSSMISNVAVATDWVGSSVFTLSVSADVSTTLTSLLPSAPRNVTVAVTTSVKRKPAEWEWSLPTIKDLSYEADDYNRLSVYCYSDANSASVNSDRRRETLTAISDNGGTDYSGARLPDCVAGETLSYKLWNVRSSRTTPSRWRKQGSKDPELNYEIRTSGVEYYTYFTDTTMDPSTRVATQNVFGGKENFSGNPKRYSISAVDLNQKPILETILCTTNLDCKSRNQGGILPNNHETGRTPATATSACADGKSMYFGWEDRPPSGSSDRDYDDIRIVMSCPSLIKIADKEIRIVK